MAKKYERFIDRFFDEENYENVELEDNDGKVIEFEQVALVDYEGNYYIILHPVTKLEGVGEDEALVFMIDENEDGVVYMDDVDIVEGVFGVYYEMLESDEE